MQTNERRFNMGKVQEALGESPTKPVLQGRLALFNRFVGLILGPYRVAWLNGIIMLLCLVNLVVARWFPNFKIKADTPFSTLILFLAIFAFIGSFRLAMAQANGMHDLINESQDLMKSEDQLKLELSIMREKAYQRRFFWSFVAIFISGIVMLGLLVSTHIFMVLIPGSKIDKINVWASAVIIFFANIAFIGSLCFSWSLLRDRD